MKNYGKELILDLHECNPKYFTRKYLKLFFKELCELIDMERCKLCWWDYKGFPKEYKKAPAHLKGTSAIQFIKTSNITVHTLDTMKIVYLNIFSCKDFNSDVTKRFTVGFFKCKKVKQAKTIRRI